MTREKCSRTSCTRTGTVRTYFGVMCLSHQGMLRNHGLSGLVPTKVVLDYIEQLMVLGWDRVLIAREAGLSHTCVQRIAHRTHVRCRTANSILAIPLRQASSVLTADPLPMVRRIQSLQTLGWGYRDLANAYPRLTFGVIASVMSQQTRFPSHATVQLVRDVFDQIGDTPGPSTRSAARARAQGFHPPAAWDDIDDPDEDPGRPVARRKWEKAPTDEVVFLASFGKSAAEIALKFDVTEAQIRAKLQREEAAA